MSTPSTPLFFPQALQSPGQWADLGKVHGLTRKDFQWLAHVKLASHALRRQQSPAMSAERIRVSSGQWSCALAGSFVLSATPDDQGEILYTPYGGLRKFDSRKSLSSHLKTTLDSADEDDDLLACLSLSARKTLAAASDIEVGFETIDGDVFADQRALLQHNQQANDQALLDELQQLPSLAGLLDALLHDTFKTAFTGVDQRRTVVNFYAEATPRESPDRRWISSQSLAEALLSYYRHRRWPIGQRPEFYHPLRKPEARDQQQWQTLMEKAADTLTARLGVQLQRFWNGMSADGATRRAFFSRVIGDKARAQLLHRRDEQIVSPAQARALQPLIEQTVGTASTLSVETVRLWEYPANYVELAGALMISQDSANAFLYTPARGFEVLKDYQDLKDTLQEKSTTAGHDDELYDLLSLEERARFIGFEQAQVSGASLTGWVFTQLFEAIIDKQQQNLDYAFQVFRHSDGAVNLQAFFDKALDIRAMLSQHLLTLDAKGRWSTRPVLSGQPPSMVLADTAASHARTFRDVELPVRSEFAEQTVATSQGQRQYLENMKGRLAHLLSVGLRGEATLRELSASLRNADWHLVDTVFNPDRPDRKSRPAIRGFYPDAFSLVLQCAGETRLLPLAQCVMLSERGGLDVEHSGRAILWTPGAGLEVFGSVGHAREQLNLRLPDPDQRLVFLENLAPDQRNFHRRYSLHSLQLISGNVLQHLMQSAIELFLARCAHLRSLKLGTNKENKAFYTLTQTLIDTNLHRAKWIADAISHQQSLPAWLGLAPVDEQQLHIELLEQYRHSIVDDKDYLHGLPTLEDYVRQTLTALLATRFPGQSLNPDEINIAPNLALAGPAQTLTEFALNHVNTAQGSGFRVTSNTLRPLPEGLNPAAINQLLLSLSIPDDYAQKVTEALSDADRQARFVKQLPWQLLHHAHSQTLQQHLSSSAFELITQVLDMPDAIARAAVAGARAMVRPLELIKTTGAKAVQALGLYLIGPGTGKTGPQVLYAPYFSGPLFSEFANETAVVAAINTPGALQDLIVRRLPDGEQASFRNLLTSSVNETSEITLGTTPIQGHALQHWFSDNTRLLARLLGSRSQASGQSDWEAAKDLFSKGIRLIARILPGKLAYMRFLWGAYKDFKDSAEALQNRHWRRALKSFIDGGAQMVALGRLSQDAPPQSPAPAPSAPIATAAVAPKWPDVPPTAPARTSLQRFEVTDVALKDLKKDASEGTYQDAATRYHYAAIAGKVYRVAKPGAVWQIVNDQENGPYLAKTAGKQLAIDLDRHTVHFGKALSTLHNRYANDYQARRVLNVEARGMEQIRALYPHKARMIVQAIDMARFYAFNSLHNLAQLRRLLPGTRLDTFLKAFFDVASVDTPLLDKIKQAIVPICDALVDPGEDLLSSERFVVGSTRHLGNDLIAFVLDNDTRKAVHFTERFFDQGLDWYKSCLTEPFNVEGHSQAATLIHEFAHIYAKALDIATLEARRPFSDLIAPITGYGAAMKQSQLDFQRTALSLASPREELFAHWNSTLSAWISLDAIPGLEHVGKEILKLTDSKTMADARSAFLNRVDPAMRIEVILHNADSLAYLITEMGRQLDPTT
ncbi:DUF6543 domain-containing protein [Pseudomonas sp. MYb118]|uniref:dermonecrotic toxin domain-containing protein n=1 Tax=Pseudomonas sp. MYb118 TaxID=1848720 RepID=UPI0034CE3C4D